MGGITWVEQDAAIRLPVEVVDEHLLQIGIAGFTVANKLPFGIDYDFITIGCGQNNVRLDAAAIPKYLGVLIRNPVAIILESSLQRTEDEALPKHVHVE